MGLAGGAGTVWSGAALLDLGRCQSCGVCSSAARRGKQLIYSSCFLSVPSLLLSSTENRTRVLCSANGLESTESDCFQLKHLSFILPVPYLNLILADICHSLAIYVLAAD